MATIGKNILENLTTGMYSDSKVTYREYIQNACDQIDKAVSLGILTPDSAEVAITIDENNRNISIEDNATGVKKNLFESQLGDIANSDKKLGEDKGFRGIGRLCGLAYCETLIFTTSFKGEPIKSIMKFDAKKMRRMIASAEKYTVDDIWAEIMNTYYEKEDAEEHYFRVDMEKINEENTDLLDSKKVREYLCFVAPVQYTNKFMLRNQIYKHAEQVGYKIDEYRIRVNGAELFKEYSKNLYEGSGPSRKIYDTIFELEFKDFFDEKNRLIAWMWYGLCRFEKAIPKLANPMYGLRLRQGNIQIGDNTVVADLFKEDRGNSYYVGEIFAVDRQLIPNSQRNYFNENETRIDFENKLRLYFCDKLHKLYHDASVTRNDYKRLEKFNAAVSTLAEKQEHGFVDEAEKTRLTDAVAAAEKEKDEAQKRLERSESPDNTKERTPTQKVQDRIKQKYKSKNVPEEAEKAKAKARELEGKEGEKTTYFTDNLSKLDKKQRKLVSRIMAIVKRVAQEDVAAKIQSEIEREFK
ncbi:MAG: ATP-binding protein [Lachnospiraceae bacterium]|nr:ATP-binding protein [Lachnospiraceae bacterium]